MIELLVSKNKFLYYFLFGLFFLNNLFSLDIPLNPKGRVSDYAGILTREQIATLDEKLEQFEKETSNQVVVAIFKNLEGESLEDFSIRLAEKWKIGTKPKDNGAILLIFLNDRKIRIEVGYGLEGALPDAIAYSIIRNNIAPYFRKKDYYGGVSSGINKIIEATKGEYKAEPSEEEETESFFIFLLLSIIFLSLLMIILQQLRQNSITFERDGWSSGRGFPKGGWGGNDDWGNRGGWGSGGGFSGGGGRFGGGGASGGW